MTSSFAVLSPDPMPAFQEAWLVHEDADLLVVHKPSGVPCHAPEARHADDLTVRLRSFLAQRDAVLPQDLYLVVHGCLDQAASGLVVFSRNPQAAASLVPQFERFAVQTQYLVCVTGYQDGPSFLRSRPRRTKGAGGRRAPQKAPALRVQPLQRSGERCMLAVGATGAGGLQLRMLLAERGAPVAGDGRYGGALAPHMLLHLERLALRHPDGTAREWSVPAPAAFELWLARGLPALLDRAGLAAALPVAVQARYALWHARQSATGITAFRLVHGEADGMPGLTVDVYGNHLVVNLSDGAFDAEADVVGVLGELGFAGVYVKRHPRQKNVLQETPLVELCPEQPSCGASAPTEFVVTEYGVPFGVRLGDGWRTGLFLDQRENRRRVAELARDKRVLNLFAYTGGFSVAALQGGAAAALCIDASAAALARARENVSRIGALERYRAHTGDVFELLPKLARRGELFDVIVLDPPSYATTKRNRFRAVKDYPALVALVLPLLAKGGYLLSCLNHHQVSPSRLRAMVAEGARLSGVQWRSHRDLSPPGDFPTAPGQQPLFKSVLSQRGDG